MAKLNLVGDRYGNLVVIKELEQSKHYTRNWLCRCDCGKESSVTLSHLRTGHTTSCGCIARTMLLKGNVRRTHSQAGTKLYKIWVQMKQRCTNPHDSAYKKYGARGTSVCTLWMDFDPFFKWANEHGYKENLTIDRINAYGNYCPDNCQWIPMSEQGVNRTKPITNTSGYSGVNYHKGKQAWVARITINGKRKQLGTYTSAEEANEAIGNYLQLNNLTEMYAAYQLRLRN